MSRTGIAVATVALACSMFFAGPALAQNANGAKDAGMANQAVAQRIGRGPLARCFFDNLAALRDLREKLGLTDEQARKTGGIWRNHKTEIIAALKSLNEANKALLAAVRADTVDEAAIKAAAGKMGEAIGTASVLRAQMRQELLGVLTPEQRAKFDAALAEISQNREDAIQELEDK